MSVPGAALADPHVLEAAPACARRPTTHRHPPLNRVSEASTSRRQGPGTVIQTSAGVRTRSERSNTSHSALVSNPGYTRAFVFSQLLR